MRPSLRRGARAGVRSPRHTAWVTPSQQQFFQIAAGLIPVLMFGGVIVDRVRTPPEHFERRRHGWIAVAIFGAGVMAVFAEITAIRGER